MPNNEQNDSEKTQSEKHFIKFRQKINAFMSVDKPDDILILKAHLLCEYYINQILIINDIPRGQTESLTFAQKIDLLSKQKIGLLTEEIRTLQKLNRLRNKVGHELEFNLSESDVDEIGYTLLEKDYIVKKYEFDDNKKLLRELLISIIMSTAVSLSLYTEDYINKKKSNK